MHLHFEKSINAKCDCSILSMSWMGKVPDELPEEEGWKLNRTHYYQEGWLATGNLRGIVGVTFTSSHWRKNLNSGASTSSGVSPGWLHDLPQRTNYNLRGHRSQITLVQWNEPYQKLASCDSSGIIFVWIKFEGRWSIELINDRSTPVTHFSWSHDGRMALICYRDGFVLVGSVAGQRYWSSMLNLNAIITCGLWSPSDQQVFLGTSNAQVIVMDVVHGMMISQVQMPMESPILSMTWSCEKFKMEENDEATEPVVPPQPSYNLGASTSAESQPQPQQPQGRQRPLLLALAFQNGTIFLMKNYDDIAPMQIYTGMQQGLMMEWSNSGEILAVVGTRPVEVINENGAKIHEYFSSLHFYNHAGVRVLNIVIPSTQWPVTALTWGHNDKRLFVATGQTIHVGWVAKRVASLQLLCRLTIYKALSNETCVSHLPLPLPVRTLISSLHTQTILSILPSDKDLLEFVSHPPCNNTRLHCTMIRHEEMWTQSPGTVYTLYLEYLGGLIPILKGKRTSKIRPHFVIYSPQGSADGASNPVPKSQTTTDQPSNSSKGKWHPDSPFPRHADHNGCPFQLLSDSSDSEDVELCASPRIQRKRHRARMRERERERQREREIEWERNRDNGGIDQQHVNQPPTAASSTLHLNNLDTFGLVPAQLSNQHLVYSDALPENLTLVEVTSNIWGTRFKIHGLESFPPNLGSLSYKTSVLHLQPRQMTCIITELTDDIFVNSTTNSNGTDSQGHHQHSSASAQQQLLDEVDDMFSIVVGSTNAAGPCSSNTSYYNGGAVDRNVIARDECANVSFRSIHARSNLASSKDDDSSYVEFVPMLPDSNSNHTDANRSTTTTLMRRQLITHAALIERIDETSSVAISTSPSVAGPSSILSHRGSVHSSPTRRRISWTKLQHESNSSALSSGDPGRSSALANGAGPSEPSPPPVQPIHVRRSISASYLDNVFERTLPTPVDMVTPDRINPQSPPKRLVLVKEQQAEEEEEEASSSNKRPINWLKDCGKSKSWDFADLAKWKQQKSAANALHMNKHPCPNCKFPTTAQSKPHVYVHDYPAPILKPLPPLPANIFKGSVTSRPATAETPSSSSSYPPKTPARKLSAPKTPMISRRRDSNEDRIERLAESPPPSSTPASTPPASPRHALSTSLNNNSLLPRTPNLQRRFSNFLTPILRRRDLFSCTSGNHSEKRKPGGNPNSTCYIPPDSPTHMAKPMSNPTTPATGRKLKAKHQSYLAAASSPIRQFFANSPLLSRRKCNNNSSSCTPNLYHRQNRQIIDSTDDEDEDNEIEVSESRQRGEARPKSSPAATCFSRTSSSNSGSSMVPPGTQAHHASSTFRDLETFQKNQLRQKLRQKKIHNIDKSPVRPKRREFVLHNKAPMWNENSQVYQLDFGGRVTQESAKNFQIEFRGKQVMQFGRIDGNAYTLDFQYPFSALQAFGVALANVTQRLK